MAGPLPPAPVKDDAGSFAWLSWYQNLRTYLNNPNSIPWNVISKANSNLADLAIKLHSSLTSILGTGAYHVSAAEAGRITATTTIQSKASAPVAADIPASNWAIYKDTTANTIRLWANDGGVLKSVLLT